MEEKELQMMETAREYVRSAGKWIQFMAILLCISIAFMFLAGIMMMAFSGAGLHLGYYPMERGFTIMMGIIYLIMAGIYIYPALCLLRAAKAAKEAVEFNNNEQMVEFLRNNKAFWKFCGIFTIVCLGLCILCLFGGIIAVIATM